MNLPPPEDEFDRKLLSDVNEYGWHCVIIRSGIHPEHDAENEGRYQYGDHVYDVGLTYSVGLWRSFSHPVIVLVGDWDHAHTLIANVVIDIREGDHFEPGAESLEI